jgi:glycosyltransferase involved in cell wall biosynthesis
VARRPSVTAVIPTHNRPQLMQRALESVLTQDYEGDVEVIVVFDACDPFLPPVAVPEGRTIQTVRNSRSRGLAGARNTGILLASHDYVAFLDDDDYWLPSKLSRQMDVFNSRQEAILVGTAMVLDDGRHRHERLVPKETVRHEDLLRDRMAGLHSSTFVFKKATLTSEIGLVDENLPGSYGEDYDLLLRTALRAPIEVVNSPLVCVSWSRDSYFFGKWAAYAEGLEYLLAQHPGFGADQEAHGRLTGQIAFARAASGAGAVARQWVARSLREDPRQIKAWLALAISLRLLSGPWVARQVQRMGKGI